MSSEIRGTKRSPTKHINDKNEHGFIILLHFKRELRERERKRGMSGEREKERKREREKLKNAINICTYSFKSRNMLMLLQLTKKDGVIVGDSKRVP